MMVMKRIIVRVEHARYRLLLAVLLTSFQAVWAMEGQYHGDISGTASTLVLQLQGQQLSGQIDAGGYIYKLQGQLTGENLAEGQFSDPQTGAAHPMRLQDQGKQVQLIIQIPGQRQPLTLTFSQGVAVQEQSNGVAKRAASERDSSLVGHWRYTESYTSGTFSGAAQWSMLLYPDGRYEYGDSKLAGGSAEVGGSSSVGDVEVGEWQTQGSTIYIKSPGQPQWQAYSLYYVEGYSLMLTFGDGSRQVWKRVQ